MSSITILSTVAGRIRLEVPVFKDDLTLIELVTQDLSLTTSLQKITANQITGTLLIYYSNEYSADEVVHLVKKSLLRQLEKQLHTLRHSKVIALSQQGNATGKLNPFKNFIEITNPYPQLRRKVAFLSLLNGIEDVTPPLILGLAIDTITRGST